MREVRWEKMTWVELKGKIDSSTVCLIPIGAIEQHGPHLNLDTDTFNVYELALRAAQKFENTLVSPPIPFGCSINHINFPGTITIRLETLKEILKDIVKSLVYHKINKIIFLIGHGGNITATNAAAEELRIEIKNIKVGVVYIANLIIKGYQCLESDIIWHADEFETSISLYLNPKEVNMERAIDEIPLSPYKSFTFREESLSKSIVNYGLPMTDECTKSGVFGYATKASKEKGKIIVEEMITNLMKIIHELKEI